MFRSVFVAFALTLFVSAQVVGQDGAPATVAEASEYQRTATYDEVVAFFDSLDELSDRVTVSSMGQTSEGRSIPLAIVADPPVAEPGDVGDRLVVFLFGNIHAGEVCGKEALSSLSRELALAEQPGVLDDLVVLVAPIYNADGNELFGPDNRPGQIGPEQMGQRPNAAGVDLNRDYVKLEAPETRGLVRVLNEWDPSVIVDTHTTNGSLHRYTITYQGPKHPAGDPEIIGYVRDTMLPAVDEAFEDATEYEAYFYGNFTDEHSRWTTYPAEPRYGTAYRGLRNRLAILSEAYSYASFEDRVLGTEAFCGAVLDYAAAHTSEIRELLEGADARAIKTGRDPSAEDAVALRASATAFPEKVTVLGYAEIEREDGSRTAGEPRDYSVELVNLFEPTLEVRRAYAYVFGEGLEWLAQKLQHHGVEVEVLREDVELEVEVYRLGEVTRSERGFEGHEMIRDVKATGVPATRRIHAGSYVVRTGQKLGVLASYLLEPQSSDGLVAWNFFDASLELGGEFPVARLVDRMPLVTRSARPLPEDRESGRRLVYDDVYGKSRLNLSGSPVGGISWVDDEQFTQRKDGELRLVHALTGRSEPVGAETDAIAERLAELPTVDEKTARQIAGRSFRWSSDESTGRVFTHEGDLYYAEQDGSNAKRLTSTPETEEMPRLSPDGAFVAYVRDNDLWVVDIATATERALTTGGSDTLRHGRNCWLYYEELFGRRWGAFWWSPDSGHLAFLISDTSALSEFTLVHDVPQPQVVEREQYAKPGQPNPHVEVGIVSRAGGTVRRVDLSGYDHAGYVVSWIGWSESSGKLRLAIQDRVQTWLDLLEVGAGGGEAKRLMRETTEAWVEPQGDPIELEDASFILASERDGWRHLYRFEKNGKLRERITEGEWEVRRVHHVDEDAGWIYFDGTIDTSIASNLYRIRLDGSDLERLTPERGSHRVSLSESGKFFVDTWSSADQPTKVALYANTGVLIRMLDTNPVYELEEWELGSIEFHSVPSEKGVELESLVVYPTDFDESRSYPVWFRTYGGPHAPTVGDSWSGGRIADRLLAEQGIIVFRGDPYPASGKGAQSAWTAYKRLGVRELEDVEELIGWITLHNWADADRVGIAGHSYGGFMAAYALTHSEMFSAGIAGAPVTSWRDYDSIYTERYMLTPQNNPDGYLETSVVEGAADLHGRLLLLHGMIDDNVHPQNTVRLIDALVNAEKQFDQFFYPGRRHGIWGGQYSRMIYDFILETMQGDQTVEDELPVEDESESETTEVRPEPVLGPAGG